MNRRSAELNHVQAAARERELEARAGCVRLGGRGAAVRLGRLAHDREAEPGARLRARRRGAVEAVEDAREVLLGDTGAVILDDHLAAADAHLDRRSRRAVLDRVLEQVRDGPLEQHRVGLHERRGECGHEPDLRRACLRALDDTRDEIVELDVLDAQLALLAARELDEIRDEPGQRVQLDGRLVERVLRLVGRQPALAQEVDVRPRRGQRRAQLVRRVRDEAALRADRRLERGEHLVEARREPSELVARVDLDTPVEVAGRGNLLCRRRQAPDRPHRGRRDERREGGRKADCDAADQEDPETDAVECAVGGRERLGDDHRTETHAVMLGRRHELAQVDLLHRCVGEVRDCRRRGASLSARSETGSSAPCTLPLVSISVRYGRRVEGAVWAAACLREQRLVELRAQLMLCDHPDRCRGGGRPRPRSPPRRTASVEVGSSRLFAEGVADAAHRLQEARLAGLFELAAEVADVDPERVRGRSEVVAPDALVDLRPRQHLARVAQEELEQVELGAGQLQAAVAARGFARRRVEADVGELQRGVAGAGAAQQGAQRGRAALRRRRA